MLVEKIITGYLEENCYIVSKNGKCLIIDPGDEFLKIDEFLKEKKYEVVGILITHYHFDHIGALDEIVEQYNAQVYDYKTIGKVQIECFKFTALKTPGHSEDSTTFYFKDEGVMFTGDFIFKSDIGRVDLKGGSIKDMIESIKMIKKYNENIKLYPGHGDETTLAEEKMYNQYLIRETL